VADTIRILGMNEVLVRVSPKVAKQAMSADDELARLGVEVREVQVRCKAFTEVNIRRCSPV